MSSTAKKNDVVKLVHPGRHIEEHKEPITASEVMKKNPRHCITRPDFFKYPWIVVKPESVLTPGKVYYIVPHYTIYKMMMNYSSSSSSSHHCDHHSDHHRKSHPSRTRRPFSFSSSSSSTTASAGMTPKHRTNSRGGFMSCTSVAPSPTAQPPGCAPRRLKKRYSQVESCPHEVVFTTRYRDRYHHNHSCHESESDQSLADSVLEKTTYYPYQHAYQESKSNLEKTTTTTYSQPYHEDGTGFEFQINSDYRQEPRAVRVDEDEDSCTARSRHLKSCLRKPDSARKSLPLKVHFNWPYIVEIANY